MTEEQQCIIIKREELLAKAQQYQVDGYRLAQICCTKLAEVLEVNYSFDRNYVLVNLRVILTCADLSVWAYGRKYGRGLSG
jgi:ech hydrogenase subunit D